MHVNKTEAIYEVSHTPVRTYARTPQSWLTVENHLQYPLCVRRVNVKATSIAAFFFHERPYFATGNGSKPSMPTALVPQP